MGNLSAKKYFILIREIVRLRDFYKLLALSEREKGKLGNRLYVRIVKIDKLLKQADAAVAIRTKPKGNYVRE